MTEVLTASQMRAIEQAAIDSGRVTGLELMERAGQGVVEAIFEEWPDLGEDGPKYATVLCGPGNNGGDGFVIAGTLMRRGWYVDVVPLTARENYAGDAAAMLARLPSRPLAIAPEDFFRANSAIFESETVLVIDAVFGTGLSRPLDDNYAALLCDNFILYIDHDFGTKCVAVDIPSGLDTDTGEVLGGTSGRAFKAHLTVTFHRLKMGHVSADGPTYCGKTKVVDIGL